MEQQKLLQLNNMVKNKSKRKKTNKPTSQKYKFYKIEGDKVKREKFCPRCGPGIFLMQAKDRVYCGKCHFTEFSTKSK
jgi:small subunit ribosomal protein S27Ae